jgi:hypothetical protein
MVRLTIDLSAGPDRPIHGRISGPDGASVEFHGTLDLVASLERLARSAAAGAAAGTDDDLG